MTFPRSRLTASAAERAEMVRRGQADFRRQLATEALDSAKRLQRAYSGTQKRLDAALKQMRVVAQSEGMTATALRSDVAVLRLQGAVQEALTNLSVQIGREARRMQETGAARGAQVAAEALRAVGIASFNQPSVQQIGALIGYVDSAAFRRKLEAYGHYHADAVSNLILSDASMGKNPIAVARHIVRYLGNVPMDDAVRITRTVQLWSARRGSQAIYQANDDVVTGWRWSSARDKRTCMACLSQHGKIFPLSAVLNGHHLCSCAMVPVTIGWDELGYDAPEALSAETGEQWFRAQTSEVQKQQMGAAAWLAWSNKAINFDQFAATYQNDIYGDMVGEASLVEMVGLEAAREFKALARAV